MLGNLKAVLSAEASDLHHQPRYVLVNMDTGKTVDDAGGHGYKSACRAYRAYGYCHPGYTDEWKRHRKKEITTWMRCHPSLSSQLRHIAAERALKDEDVQQKLLECEIYEMPFTVHELARTISSARADL